MDAEVLWVSPSLFLLGFITPGLPQICTQLPTIPCGCCSQTQSYPKSMGNCHLVPRGCFLQPRGCPRSTVSCLLVPPGCCSHPWGCPPPPTKGILGKPLGKSTKPYPPPGQASCVCGGNVQKGPRELLTICRAFSMDAFWRRGLQVSTWFGFGSPPPSQLIRPSAESVPYRCQSHVRHKHHLPRGRTGPGTPFPRAGEVAR